MSNDTNTNTNTTDAKPKGKRQNPRIDHSSLIASYAKAKNIDTTRAGKLVRARLRSNFAEIAKNDSANYGPKGTVKREANDKRPWGDHKRATMKALGLLK